MGAQMNKNQQHETPNVNATQDQNEQCLTILNRKFLRIIRNRVARHVEINYYNVVENQGEH